MFLLLSLLLIVVVVVVVIVAAVTELFKGIPWERHISLAGYSLMIPF